MRGSAFWSVLVACTGSPELPPVDAMESDGGQQTLHMARKQVLFAWVAVQRGECAHAEARMKRAMALRNQDPALQTMAQEMQLECEAHLAVLKKDQDEDSP